MGGVAGGGQRKPGWLRQKLLRRMLNNGDSMADNAFSQVDIIKIFGWQLDSYFSNNSRSPRG
jgi:hypothetical protein